MLYNIPVYKKLGLTVPKTWDEFMANSKKIKDAGGVDPVEQTYGETWTSQLFVLGDFANVEAAVPDFADEVHGQPGQATRTRPAALAGFQHIQQVKDAGFLNKDFASATLNDGMKAVATGDRGAVPAARRLGGEHREPGARQDRTTSASSPCPATTRRRTT